MKLYVIGGKYVFFKKEKVVDSSGDKKFAGFAVQDFS